jgi:heat shock protein HslJ
MRMYWSATIVLALACAQGRQAASEPDTAQPSLQVDLGGTAWRLSNIGGQSALEGVEATLSFPNPGRAAGRASCNQFFGAVAIDGAAIRFSSLGTTRMACDAPIMSQEQRYLQALQSAERFTVAGDTLVVHPTAGGPALRFVREK